MTGYAGVDVGYLIGGNYEEISVGFEVFSVKSMRLAHMFVVMVGFSSRWTTMNSPSGVSLGIFTLDSNDRPCFPSIFVSSKIASKSLILMFNQCRLERPTLFAFTSCGVGC